MQIPVHETILPLVEAVEQATGRRPHLSTVLRWCQSRNRHGIRLESWLIGGRRVTTVASVHRYVERTTAAADPAAATAHSHASRRSKAHAQAVAELAKEL